MDKIILISDYYRPHIGGIENSLYFISQELIKMNLNPIIVTSDKGLGNNHLNSKEKIDGVLVLRYKYYKPRIKISYVFKPIMDALRIRKILKQAIRKEGVSLVISRSVSGSLSSFGLNLNTIYIVPGLVKLQSFIQIKSSGPKKYFLTNILKPINVFLQNLALKHVEYIVTFSKNMSSQVKNETGRKNIIILNPGVDIDRFKPSHDKKELKKELGLDEDHKIFLIVGRLSPLKGIKYAIRALNLQKYMKSILLIVGDGPLMEELKKQTKDLNLMERVKFIGAVNNNIESYYKVSDVYLMTSIHETFGQTILEALATGLPVVAWKPSKNILTSTSEIIEDNVNGRLINFSVEELARTMDSYYKKENNRVMANNRSLVKSHYSWRNFTIKLLDVNSKSQNAKDAVT